jgi:hypothetical protein
LQPGSGVKKKIFGEIPRCRIKGLAPFAKNHRSTPSTLTCAAYGVNAKLAERYSLKKHMVRLSYKVFLMALLICAAAQPLLVFRLLAHLMLVSLHVENLPYQEE